MKRLVALTIALSMAISMVTWAAPTAEQQNKIKTVYVNGDVVTIPSDMGYMFVDETGRTITEYIKEQKLEAAAYQLKHTNETSAAITRIFQFSSESYFIQIFKKKYGITPREFRNAYFRRNLKNDIKSHNDVE